MQQVSYSSQIQMPSHNGNISAPIINSNSNYNSKQQSFAQQFILSSPKDFNPTVPTSLSLPQPMTSTSSSASFINTTNSSVQTPSIQNASVTTPTQANTLLTTTTTTSLTPAPSQMTDSMYQTSTKNSSSASSSTDAHLIMKSNDLITELEVMNKKPTIGQDQTADTEKKIE